VLNNLIYIGNLRALQAWYRHVRRLFAADSWARACHEGALGQLQSVLDERIKRLKELAEKMPRSLEIARAGAGGATLSGCAEQEQLAKAWPAMEAALQQGPAESAGAAPRDRFLVEVEAVKGLPYLEAIRALSPAAKRAGTVWLQALVDAVAAVGGFNP
jgi:UDP-N-acetylglucosamine/UDP-N-acetylgalactosamine diphosphorylase